MDRSSNLTGDHSKNHSKNRVGTAIATVSLLMIPLFVSACGGQDDGQDLPDDETEITLEGDAMASRVLLAAILLATGDIDKAIVDGLVTPADVEAAVNALENGTLDAWREQAEAEYE